MARAKKRTPQVEEVRPYVEGVAKNLIDKLYGPDGPVWGPNSPRSRTCSSPSARCSARRC